MKSSGPSGLLGGGGADKKKVMHSKPSTRSRSGTIFHLRGAPEEGVKVVCNSIKEGNKVAEKMATFDKASVTTSEAPSEHPAYHLNTSLDGN